LTDERKAAKVLYREMEEGLFDEKKQVIMVTM
jgi:hypothetical protein